MNDPLSIRPFGAADKSDWDAFLAVADNGTLYHDLRFLAYHPDDRYAYHHLVVRRAGLVRSIIPGGISIENGQQWFRSPLGASIGGPVIAENCTLREAEDLIAAFQQYVIQQGLRGIKVALAPAAFDRKPSQLVEFALYRRGFTISHRFATFAIPISGRAEDGFRNLYRQGQTSGVRAAQKKGMSVEFGGSELLADFLVPFRDTYARLGTQATHSVAEIEELLMTLPSRVYLCVAKLGAEPAAALLLFRLNDFVTTTFYICSASAHSKEHGVATAVATLIDRLGLEGCRYLDLGPSASDEHVNTGVVFFKEGLGAKVFCRDHWVWTAANHDGVRATQH